jgi:hypothetical protein
MAWMGRKAKVEKAAKRIGFFKPALKLGKVAKTPEAEALWARISREALLPKAQGGLGMSKAGFKASRKEAIITDWLASKGAASAEQMSLMLHDELEAERTRLNEARFGPAAFEQQTREAERQQGREFHPLPPATEEQWKQRLINILAEEKFKEAEGHMQKLKEEDETAIEREKRRKAMRKQLSEDLAAFGIQLYSPMESAGKYRRTRDVVAEYRKARENLRKAAEELNVPIQELSVKDAIDAVRAEAEKKRKELEWIQKPIKAEPAAEAWVPTLQEVYQMNVVGIRRTAVALNLISKEKAERADPEVVKRLLIDRVTKKPEKKGRIAGLDIDMEG